MITQEFVDKYNLNGKSHNGYIFTLVTKGMYGIPQAGHMPHYSLAKHLEPYGCRPSSKTLVLWTQDSWTIHFTLVVNNFGVNIQ